ncbi:DUF7144 family membrane protein [Actinoplanes sp. CA-030573]|uniref:DUF7144 family membrane protein n=1 Tax=Actinoplanes sp. CA-030573 TaxID=3239898 RepID=UPI003D8DE129
MAPSIGGGRVRAPHPGQMTRPDAPAGDAEPTSDGGGKVSTHRSDEASGWVAWILFGGLMLVLLGGAHLTIGSLALVRPEALEGSRSDMLLSISLTGLGWVHIGLGIVLMVVGGGLMLGQVWARVLAIVLACVALVINFAYVSVYPIWSVVAIGLSGIVLYATVAHGGELTRAYQH